MAHHDRNPPTVPAADHFFTQVETYPWSSDRDFQSGLVAILGPSPSSSPATQLEDLTLRARCFYFTRKYDTPVDFSEYKGWRDSQPAAALSPLVASIITESPITPSSTRSPLWPRSGNATSPQSPNGTEIDPASRDAFEEDLVFDVARELSSQPKVNESQMDSQQRTPPSQPNYPSSFEEIMHLIQTGQPIPGIKDIPDVVLVGQGTEATRTKRKKPWEKEQIDSSQLHEASVP